MLFELFSRVSFFFLCGSKLHYILLLALCVILFLSCVTYYYYTHIHHFEIDLFVIYEFDYSVRSSAHCFKMLVLSWFEQTQPYCAFSTNNDNVVEHGEFKGDSKLETRCDTHTRSGNTACNAIERRARLNFPAATVQLHA